MPFDPKTSKYPYPESTDGHYIKIKKDDGTVFDESYPYVDKSFRTRFKQFWVRVCLNLIVFPAARIRLGLRIHGKENLKKNRDLLKKGAVSCSNHVHFWDYICIMRAIRPFKPYVPVWAPNVRGESGSLVRAVGGIPIPENDIHASAAFLKDIADLLNNGWLHFYPEGSMWEFYQPIRPFKTGASYIACKYCKPIVPLAFSYRRPGWIRRTVFKQIALFDLSIGEPLAADESLPRRDSVIELTERCNKAVCVLAGIEHNIYTPVFDNSKRIDYYTDKYGD